MLDFSQVSTQLKALSSQQIDQCKNLEAAGEIALRRLQAIGERWDWVRQKVDSSKTSWLLAEWDEDPNQATALPVCPHPCVVFSADGSQIVSDRHDIALICLLNVGFVTLRYGAGERATLTSRPQISTPDSDLLNDDDNATSPISPTRLAQRRTLEELRGLNELIEIEKGRNEGSLFPSVALTDGTLIMWLVESEEPSYRSRFLTEFQSILHDAEVARVPVAGYISRPMSRDVINSLRVSACSFPNAHCETHCEDRPTPRRSLKPIVHPPCAGTELLTDEEMFAKILQKGERSVLFRSRAKLFDLEEYLPINHIFFFYLNTGREIARIEIPRWVATDAALLAQTHALCYDQACKGDGYPVAIAEAHEQAIVRGGDRAAFFHLIQKEMVRDSLLVSITQKSLAKRSPRV